MSLVRRYHVPRSQVWAGSRGRQAGLVHLHTTEPIDSGRLRRQPGQALCTTKPAWYERDPVAGEHDCKRCLACASRHGLEVPEPAHRDEPAPDCPGCDLPHSDGRCCRCAGPEHGRPT